MPKILIITGIIIVIIIGVVLGILFGVVFRSSSNKAKSNPGTPSETCDFLLSYNFDCDGSYSLTSNIDCTGFSLEMLCNDGFTGTINGNDFSIENLILSNNDINDLGAAIFVNITEEGIVQDLTIKNVNFKKRTEAYNVISILTANNYGTIQNVAFINCSNSRANASYSSIVASNNYGQIKNVNILSSSLIGGRVGGNEY